MSPSSLLGIKKMEAAIGESRSIRLFGVDIPISSPPAKKPLSSPLMMGIKKHIRLYGVDIAKDGGIETNLMTRKSLTECDCHGNQARLTISCKQITYQPLTNSEQKWLNSRDQYGKPNKIMIDVFDPEMRTWNMALKKWDSGSSSSYILHSAWNALKDVNQLKQGHPVEEWSFRVGGTLGLAISC
ncbi:hypothetical protein Droror1_Dr00014521 [Drosera rotundifolia]